MLVSPTEQQSTVTYTVGSGWRTTPSFAYTKGPNSYAWAAKVGGAAVVCTGSTAAVVTHQMQMKAGVIDTHGFNGCLLQVTFTNTGPNNVVLIVTDRYYVSELPIIADSTGSTVSTRTCTLTRQHQC